MIKYSLLSKISTNAFISCNKYHIFNFATIFKFLLLTLKIMYPYDLGESE